LFNWLEFSFKFLVLKYKCTIGTKLFRVELGTTKIRMIYCCIKRIRVIRHVSLRHRYPLPSLAVGFFSTLQCLIFKIVFLNIMGSSSRTKLNILWSCGALTNTVEHVLTDTPREMCWIVQDIGIPGFYFS
jgi:hypothetical protein